MTPFELIKSDLFRHTGKYDHILLIKNLLNSNRSFKYTFWLRLCNSKNKIISIISRVMHNYLSIKYQIQIPKETNIGPGLYLSHATSIIISPTAEIGSNCNISQFTNIGSNHGQAAKIGNNVYIGPQTCVVENITIGNNSTIGAGSIVIKDIQDNITAAGNPAVEVSKKEPARYILNKYKPK